MEFGGKRVTSKYESPTPLCPTARENSQNPFPIFPPQVRAHMENKWGVAPKSRKFRQACLNFIGRQNTVRITQTEGDLLEERFLSAAADEALRVPQSRLGIAADGRSALQTLNNPALKQFPGGASWAIGLFSE